jgi:hypothetical protein
MTTDETEMFSLAVIHSVAHIVNGVNFVNHYDEKHLELNWAQDKHDVRTEAINLRVFKSSSLIISLVECFSACIFDTVWLFRVADACVSRRNVGFVNATNARVLIQQLSRDSSSVSAVIRYDVVSSCQVEL